MDSLEDMKAGLKTEVAELEEEADKVRGQIDEQKLEEDINELLVTQIQEVLAPIENNPRVQRVGKIDVSKYKETAFDKSKVIAEVVLSCLFCYNKYSNDYIKQIAKSVK